MLTQTAAITPTVITDIADGLPFMMRLTQTQVTAQRMGNAQIVEAAVAKRLRGKKVTLGGKLRSSLAQVIRYAVLEWTGTADAPTSDVVQLWTSSTYAPGGFFLGSNLAVSAVGSITLAANTITDFSLLADVSSACNNLIVFCWTEGTAAQNATVDLAWSLVEGDASAEKWPYAMRHPQQELALCLRYLQIFEKNYSPGSGLFYASTLAIATVKLHAPMRTPPTVGFGASASDFRAVGPSGAFTPSSIVASNVTATAFQMDMAVSGATAGYGLVAQITGGSGKITADGEI